MLIEYRLSKAQRRHLIEMLGPLGATLYWHPRNQGERACAAALKEKGLLAGDVITYSSAYWLTDDGLRIARELQEAERG